MSQSHVMGFLELSNSDWYSFFDPLRFMKDIKHEVKFVSKTKPKSKKWRIFNIHFDLGFWISTPLFIRSNSFHSFIPSKWDSIHSCLAPYKRHYSFIHAATPRTLIYERQKLNFSKLKSKTVPNWQFEIQMQKVLHRILPVDCDWKRMKVNKQINIYRLWNVIRLHSCILSDNNNPKQRQSINILESCTVRY